MANRFCIATTVTMLLVGRAFPEGRAPIATARELRAAIAKAGSPADHARIAAYCRAQAIAFRQRQVEEEKVAAYWAPKFAKWNKRPNPYHTAISRAAHFQNDADRFVILASIQDELANTSADTKKDGGRK